MNYWLVKTEPDVFSIEDLANAKASTARWDEIRNYQARNYLRDALKVGDTVFIYHSRCKTPAVVGRASVVRAGYPDPSQFDQTHAYYDPKSRIEAPRWYCVDLRHTATFAKPLSLATVKQIPELGDMALVKQGRLSVQPVTAKEAAIILTEVGG